MKNIKLKKVLKYLARITSYTLLTILIIAGLSLLFVFVSSKVAKSKDQEPPINLFTIISPSMTPAISVYDVVASIKTAPSKIMVGDVISFYSSNPNVNGVSVTHRVVQVIQNENQFFFKTKGDANLISDTEVISQDKVIGKVYFKIPQLGKVQFFLGSKGGWIIAIMVPALAIISYDIYKIVKLIIIKQKIKTYQDQEHVVANDSNVVPSVTEDEIKADIENNKISIEPISALEQNIENDKVPEQIDTNADSIDDTKDIKPEENLEELFIDDSIKELAGEVHNENIEQVENKSLETEKEDILVID